MFSFKHTSFSKFARVKSLANSQKFHKGETLGKVTKPMVPKPRFWAHGAQKCQVLPDVAFRNFIGGNPGKS